MTHDKLWAQPLEGEKVVFARDLVEAEKQSIKHGEGDTETYMKNAAKKMFDIVVTKLKSCSLDRILLFCGVGNNAGDAYCLGVMLLENGYFVSSYQVFSLKKGALSEKYAMEFQNRGGVIHDVREDVPIDVPDDCVLIDGIFGVGWHSNSNSDDELTKKANYVIHAINAAANFVISIDIPSGLSGDDGWNGISVVVAADLTITIGYIKVGLLYNQGIEFSGEIQVIDFGLPEKYMKSVNSFAYIVNSHIIPNNFPLRKKSSHKYEVGQVIVIAGSHGMMGAAVLSSTAALRGGSGIVRLFHFDHNSNMICGLPAEIIYALLPLEFQKVLDELPRTKAILLGPGVGRSESTGSCLSTIWRAINCPVVIDGDALSFFVGGIKDVILTPHQGELKRLLHMRDEDDQLELIAGAQQFSQKHGAVLVCKGAPTTVVHAGHPHIIIPYGNDGMATAGSGDVLAGIIVALLAQRKGLREASVLGATIHALAGDSAKNSLSKYYLLASDIIAALPDVFLQKHHH